MGRPKNIETAFEAAGFSAEEAAVMEIRELAAIEIERYVQRRRMTQTAAAIHFGVSQPRISNILAGKLDKFSLDQLLRLAFKAGKSPALTFRTVRKSPNLSARAAA